MKYYLRKQSARVVSSSGLIVNYLGDRALYYSRRLRNRRYRDFYPIPNDIGMVLYTCKTLKHILKERQALFEYCGELFDVYDENGIVDLEQGDIKL